MFIRASSATSFRSVSGSFSVTIPTPPSTPPITPPSTPPKTTPSTPPKTPKPRLPFIYSL
ncbi:MAG TPA: hypothetical protein ENL46_00920 [Candidatus Aminicenantes bacterium]|nr:hypothetical protein [Candidatus Aminicenantes bacterium]